MSGRYRFNSMEMAGALGDLGTLLPMAMAMIVVNGLDPMGILVSIGLLYILSGIYFGVPTPVQPMKVISAYAIATAMTPSQILASGALMGVFLLIMGATNTITVIGRYIPKPVVRGVQLSTGVLLMAQGIKFMIGVSVYQELKQLAEPYLSIQSLGPLPLGIVIGVIAGGVTLLLIDSRKLPAGLVLVLGGGMLGGVLGTHEGFAEIRPGLYLPSLLPFGIPDRVDFTFALFALVLPQIPMTIGNAVIANADLSADYFGRDSKRVTYRALSVSMGLACLSSSMLGGMPLCHGAGGLAAHYRFGARTAGSNLMIGGVFLALALFLGYHALAVLHLIPMAILGVLLLFAGSQLALTIGDMHTRKELFVPLVMLGITLVIDLAVGFMVGIVVAYVLKSDRISV